MRRAREWEEAREKDEERVRAEGKDEGRRGEEQKERTRLGKLRKLVRGAWEEVQPRGGTIGEKGPE